MTIVITAILALIAGWFARIVFDEINGTFVEDEECVPLSVALEYGEAKAQGKDVILG